MMDINQDLYARLLCQISGRINEEGTSLMKLYLQAKMLVKVKKLESHGLFHDHPRQFHHSTFVTLILRP
jgi:hypothetical protein